MHDETNNGSTSQSSTDERDALGALISAAGRRPVPPQDAYDRVRAASYEAWQRKLRTRSRRRRLVALAATLAGVAVSATLISPLLQRAVPTIVASTSVIEGEVLIQRPGQDDWESVGSIADPIAAGTRVRTTVNGRLALALADDASLRIDSETTATLIATRRIELITGRLYLDAGADNAVEPFSVTTSVGTVRDIGTQFEVASLENTVRIRVREGAVELTPEATTDTVTGSAGEQLNVRRDGVVERDPFSPFDPDWGWAETLAGTPEVEGQSLLLFLSWVARETGRELRFDAPVTETRARTVILHGSAENLTPLQALDVMLSTTDFDYTLGNDGILLISPRAAVP